jgi:hypothetical protein
MLSHQGFSYVLFMVSLLIGPDYGFVQNFVLRKITLIISYRQEGEIDQRILFFWRLVDLMPDVGHTISPWWGYVDKTTS